MKTESTALARQRETKCHEEREGRHRPWIIFAFSIVVITVLVCWFHFHSFTSCVRSLFGANPKVGTTTFVLSGVQLSSPLIMIKGFRTIVFIFIVMSTTFRPICTLWRCPWCNCYRRRKWTRQHEFKSWTRLIAFPIALIPLGKVWIQLFSLQLWVNSRTD